MNIETVELWRPVGPAELAVIVAAKMRSFPPRLPDQPIFYPVATEASAVKMLAVGAHHAMVAFLARL
jgi:hypothetical protein